MVWLDAVAEDPIGPPTHPCPCTLVSPAHGPSSLLPYPHSLPLVSVSFQSSFPLDSSCVSQACLPLCTNIQHAAAYRVCLSTSLHHRHGVRASRETPSSAAFGPFLCSASMTVHPRIHEGPYVSTAERKMCTLAHTNTQANEQAHA
jgi:hypothetical protein